jgi:hypothetical protein
MKSISTILFSIVLCISGFGQTEIERTNAIRKEMSGDTMLGWHRFGSIGFNMGGLGIINPLLGGGEDNLNLTGVGSFGMKMKGVKDYWNSQLTAQLGVQQVASPFVKNADVIRLESRYGYDLNNKGKIFAAINGLAESQMLRTFSGGNLSGETSNLLSQFGSPLLVNIAPGIDYKVNKRFGIFVSPISYQGIFVLNNQLANLPGQPLGNEAGLNNRQQYGFVIAPTFATTMLDKRISFSSKANWFGDYTQNMNGRILWQNLLSLKIYKGLNLDLFGDLNYNHFQRVIKNDQRDLAKRISPTDPGFINLQTQAPNYIGGFLLAYKSNF